MRKKHFFRIEKDGIGPYNFYAEYEWQTHPHTTKTQPGPFQDKTYDGKLLGKKISELDFFIREVSFCFSTKRKLQQWFCDDELKYLLNDGFEILKISSFNYIIAKKQAVVLKKTATTIDKISSYIEFTTRFDIF